MATPRYEARFDKDAHSWCVVDAANQEYYPGENWVPKLIDFCKDEQEARSVASKMNEEQNLKDQ